MLDRIILIFELLGVVSFAASGAAVAIRKRMDMFGVIVLGVCASVGGGMIRDIILGLTPPTVFRNPIYAAVASVVSLIIFFPRVRRLLLRNHAAYELTLLILDTLGLGIFTVMGIKVACDAGYQSSAFLLVFVGTITGVGGGMLRDVLANSTPQIFVKHFYACASIIGSIVCVALWNVIGMLFAMLAGAVTVITVRLLAAKFHWGLPNATTDEESMVSSR